MENFSLYEKFNNLDETAEENNVTIGGYLVEYSQDGKKLIQAVGSINDFVIPKGTTIICKGAFSGIEFLEKIFIPDTVTCIEDYAFQGCCSLNNVIIPQGVKIIGKNAFEGCERLKTIELSDTVESIGERAFGCCHSLEKITIPESVKMMGDGVFDGCSSLKTIIFEGIVEEIGVIDGWMEFGKYGPICGEYLYGYGYERELAEQGYDIEHHYDEDRFEEELEEERLKWRNLKILIPFGEEEYYSKLLNHYYVMKTAQPLVVHNYSLTATDEDIKNGIKDEYGVIYSRDGKRLLKCKSSSIKKYEIKDGTIVVCNEAFSRCKSLQEIHTPDSLTQIGEEAFYMCTTISKIHISSSVYSIGKNAFQFCRHIRSIHIDPKNKNYDSRNNCNAIIETNTNTLVVGCASTVIPDSVTQIGNGAFACQRPLSSMQIPKSIVHIGNAAFFECYALSKIIIPESVTCIGYNAFRDCYNVRSIHVDKNNKHYDSRNDCNAIIDSKNNILVRGCDSTIIPESVTHIGDAAFSCCSFSKIHIPASVTYIGDAAFESCNNLCEIIIPESVTHIGNRAFGFCESLTKIIIPKGSRSKFEHLLPVTLHQKIIEQSEGNDIVTHNSTSKSVAMKCKRTYREFHGSYAQDIAGFDDDTIYDAFEGDPENYWNID